MPLSSGQGRDGGEAHREDVDSLEPRLQKEKRAKEEGKEDETENH